MGEILSREIMRTQRFCVTRDKKTVMVIWLQALLDKPVLDAKFLPLVNQGEVLHYLNLVCVYALKKH